MKIYPKNWGEFQHYKDRSPTWIKLHASILDDYDYCMMHVASRALAPMLWLLASRYANGEITDTPVKVAFKLRMSLDDYLFALKPLIDNGFFVADSEMLAECYQDACLEKRREEKSREEKEENTEAKSTARKARTPSASGIQILIDLGISQQVAEDYMKVRKDKNAKSFTQTALDGIKQEAEKAGWPLENALRECVIRGWVGFKAEWVNKTASTAKPNAKPSYDDGVKRNYGTGGLL